MHDLCRYRFPGFVFIAAALVTACGTRYMLPSDTGICCVPSFRVLFGRLLRLLLRYVLTTSDMGMRGDVM